jgi:ketosteroid isomerase-like protein
MSGAVLASATRHDAVHAFMTDYLAAFERMDARAFAAYFAYPVHIADDGGDRVELHVFGSEAEFVPALEGLFASYRKIGATSGAIRDLSVVEIDARLAHAVVDWDIRNARGQTLYGCRVSYTLARAGQAWRVTAIAQNEGPRLRDYVARHASAGAGSGE